MTTMPLVILCGFPCSGKSTVTKHVQEVLREKYNVTVKIISDHDHAVSKNATYLGNSVHTFF